MFSYSQRDRWQRSKFSICEGNVLFVNARMKFGIQSSTAASGREDSPFNRKALSLMRGKGEREGGRESLRARCLSLVQQIYFASSPDSTPTIFCRRRRCLAVSHSLSSGSAQKPRRARKSVGTENKSYIFSAFPLI